nr:SCP2 sterol-binding domain-containing protein [Tropicimonas marinistellae]
MSDLIDKAVAALSERLSGPVNGSAKFVIEGEGALMIDGEGVRAGEEDADVTLSADAETFQAILAGETNPTAAYMTGKLTVEGDMGLAMQLGAALA